jgi:hypothetical protein
MGSERVDRRHARQRADTNVMAAAFHISTQANWTLAEKKRAAIEEP